MNGRNSVEMSVDLSALDALIAGYEGDITAAVEPTAQAAAEVIYRAVLRNVDAIGKVTGNLRAAIYSVLSRDNSTPVHNGYARATYHISWSAKKAPHGHLIEFGHIQRYAVYVGKDGKWHTAIRPGKRGQPKPGRRASQAQKDAYYVPRPGGMQQIPARSFIGTAGFTAGNEAVAAAKAKFFEVMGK